LRLLTPFTAAKSQDAARGPKSGITWLAEYSFLESHPRSSIEFRHVEIDGDANVDAYDGQVESFKLAKSSLLVP
jgi:hypothetical protein